MALIADAVMGAARLRHWVGGGRTRDWEQKRLRFIRDNVPGRSFVDVGGMYGIDGDIAFRAEQEGARPVTVFDAGEATPAFLDRHEKGASSVRHVPPVDYFRRRGERLSAGYLVPFDGYYEKGPEVEGTPEDRFPRRDAGPKPDPLVPRVRRWKRR